MRARDGHRLGCAGHAHGAVSAGLPGLSDRRRSGLQRLGGELHHAQRAGADRLCQLRGGARRSVVLAGGLVLAPLCRHHRRHRVRARPGARRLPGTPARPPEQTARRSPPADHGGTGPGRPDVSPRPARVRRPDPALPLAVVRLEPGLSLRRQCLLDAGRGRDPAVDAVCAPALHGRLSRHSDRGARGGGAGRCHCLAAALVGRAALDAADRRHRPGHPLHRRAARLRQCLHADRQRAGRAARRRSRSGSTRPSSSAAPSARRSPPRSCSSLRPSRCSSGSTGQPASARRRGDDAQRGALAGLRGRGRGA